ncbi:hypothetical protein B9Z55_013840 [Caenorhabditis nigoni]|uniref:Uncharacterized protein n=1 Tax=Caenorhabditis nigoni TaxID=1611254 RepID=A0A2G5U3G7_9PELO|nr:hypothetical protein B9Z55_013840 [Caenorhabditis nigoni]
MLATLTAAKYLTLSFAIFYTFAVLFGAPFFSDIIATTVLAATLTLVTALPAVLIFDSEEKFLEVLLLAFSADYTKTTKESIYILTSIFAIFGAWAAAAVHPLDWDRWWQVRRIIFDIYCRNYKTATSVYADSVQKSSVLH